MSGINNIYILNPTAVAKLLQYSGSRVEHRDGFSSYKRFTVKAKNGEFNLDFGVLVKTGELMVWKTEI